MDKNINTFCMRLKEWFSWHFPELTRIVNDNIIFSKLVFLIEKRENINDYILDDFEIHDYKYHEVIKMKMVA